MRRRSVGVALCAVLVVGGTSLLGGCGDGGGATTGSGAVETFSVRDSAGVRIVENRAPAWVEGGGWRLDPVPRLTLGSAGIGEADPGEDDEVLFQRVAGVQILGDGRVAVLDGGDATVRIFDGTGAETERWGRFGEGPEEFQGPQALLRLPGDTLVVWDPPSTSLVRLVPGTGIVDRTPLTRIDGVQLRAPSIAADGRVLMAGFVWPPGSGEQDPGIYRGTAPILVHADDGSTVDTLALRPARQIMVAELMGRPVVGDPPFSADLHALWVGRGPEGIPTSDRAAVGDGLARTAEGDAWLWQVDVIDTTGVVEVIRGPAGDLTLTDADRAWYLDQLAARATSPQERALMPQMERALIWPQRRPAWSGIERDDTGHLWLRLGRHLPPTGPSTRWRIVSPAGAWLGDLELPDGFEPHHIAPDEMAGVHTDELGVQRVRIHALERDRR